MKNYLKKALYIAPWLALIAIGVHFSSQALTNFIDREFIQPSVGTHQRFLE